MARNRATAQTLKNLEGAVSIFGQFSGTSNGNGVKDSPTDSLGGIGHCPAILPSLVRLRGQLQLYPLHREVLHAFPSECRTTCTRFPAPIWCKGQPSRFSACSLSARSGVGALIFLPTTVGGQKYNQQTRVPLLYEFGVNYPILTSHLGLRLQYRGSVLQDAGLQCAATDHQRQAANL